MFVPWGWQLQIYVTSATLSPLNFLWGCWYTTDTDKLICIQGLVIRATHVVPDMEVAFFRCLTCSHTVWVEIDRGKIEEPVRCPRHVWGSVGTMSLVHNLCELMGRSFDCPAPYPMAKRLHNIVKCVWRACWYVQAWWQSCRHGHLPERPCQGESSKTTKSLFKTYLDVQVQRLCSA